jgi:hypothetical protein
MFGLAQLQRDLLPRPPVHASKHQWEQVHSDRGDDLLGEDPPLDFFCLVGQGGGGYLKRY